MSKRKQETFDKKTDWKEHAGKVKVKRTSRNGKSSKDKTTPAAIIIPLEETILKHGEFKCILHATDPAGALKKYPRLTSQEYVNFEFDEITLETIKEACNKHFRHKSEKVLPPGMTCDLLTSDLGPSCEKLSHLEEKLAHVRFIKIQDRSNANGNNEYESTRHSTTTTTQSTTNKMIGPSHNFSTSTKLPKILKSAPPPKILKSKMVAPPKSLGVSSMLKLGKPIIKINSSFLNVELSDFEITNSGWSKPTVVKFKVGETPFASGGFRHAFRAKTEPFDGKEYVLKKYTAESLKNLYRLEETPNAHARKSVQLNALASNFAAQMKNELPNEYLCMEYNNLMLGTVMETKEIVTVERFIEGQFLKYVNNDGNVIPTNGLMQDMAEAFSHFTFAKSNSQLMVLDIQGSNEIMFDPEVATVGDTYDENGSLNFCMGNMSKEAIVTFFRMHKCGTLCQLLKIDSLKIVDVNE